MYKKVAIAVIVAIAFTEMVCATVILRPSTGKNPDRFHVAKVLQATGLVFGKDLGPTAFIFQLQPGDSIKIDCGSCASLLGSGATLSGMSLVFKYKNGETVIDRSNLGKWIGQPVPSGKVALVFTRNDLGERYLHVPSLAIFRKAAAVAQTEAGVPIGLLEVSNLCLPKSDAGTTRDKTAFFFPFRADDQYSVQETGSNGQHPLSIIGNVFKVGEEFASQPIVAGKVTRLPAQGTTNSLFGFEFAEVSSTKGMNAYHIDIDRIPLRSAGESSMQDK
jgi:hypothetical protein